MSYQKPFQPIIIIVVVGIIVVIVLVTSPTGIVIIVAIAIKIIGDDGSIARIQFVIDGIHDLVVVNIGRIEIVDANNSFVIVIDFCY